MSLIFIEEIKIPISIANSLLIQLHVLQKDDIENLKFFDPFRLVLGHVDQDFRIIIKYCNSSRKL